MPLAPSGTLQALTSADYFADKVPGDGQVLTLDFKTLRC